MLSYNANTVAFVFLYFGHCRREKRDGFMRSSQNKNSTRAVKKNEIWPNIEIDKKTVVHIKMGGINQPPQYRRCPKLQG
jgi:hypothetical protein